MKLQTKITIGVILFLVTFSTVLFIGWNKERKERKRQETNVTELTKSRDQSNLDLTLTRNEFAKMNTDWSHRIDSVRKANGLKLKRVTEVYEMEIAYKDSALKLAKMGSPTPIKEETKDKPIQHQSDSKARYKVSFEQSDSCFNVSGNVLSIDPYPQVQITDRSYEAVGDLFAVRKQFLGFLWPMKPTKYIAVSNCGTTEYKHIKFVK